MSYCVNAEWDDTGWWVVTVPDVPGAITQSRRLDQVPADAAEVIEIQTGQPVEPESAEERTRAAVDPLHRRGFPLRDIGSLTGIKTDKKQK